MRADASFAVPVKLWALLCVFAGVTIGGNVLLTCILTGGALLYLVLQRNFRLAASYGCFYLLLALLLYGIRFHGLRMPVFSEFYVLMSVSYTHLVGETASELLTRFKAAQDDYFDLVPEGRAKDSLELSTQHLHELVAFMYDHFDEFKLILCRAEGTGYADFIEVLVELEVDRSEEYYALLRKNGMLSGSMTRQLHHMITRAYFTAVCETIVHDMPREEAMKYVDELAIFFHSGWSGLLRLE